MRQRIDRGIWAAGEKISTLEELEREFSVARVTIRQAVDLLRQEGLLDAQQGRGTFVSRKLRNRRWLNLATDMNAIVANIKDNVIKRVHIEENAAPPELKEEEGILADGYAFLRSVQYNDGEPFSVVNLHLARHIFERGGKRFAYSAALPQILQMEDVKVVRAPQTFTIGVADPQTSTLLEIGLGEPTADSRLILIDSEGVAIYVAEIHYHKDCFALRVELL
jgi:GntR family transcriptional regulator